MLWELLRSPFQQPTPHENTYNNTTGMESHMRASHTNGMAAVHACSWRGGPFAPQPRAALLAYGDIMIYRGVVVFPCTILCHAHVMYSLCMRPCTCGVPCIWATNLPLCMQDLYRTAAHMPFFLQPHQDFALYYQALYFVNRMHALVHLMCSSTCCPCVLVDFCSRLRDSAAVCRNI